jgi:hypothetical protein
MVDVPVLAPAGELHVVAEQNHPRRTEVQRQAHRLEPAVLALADRVRAARDDAVALRSD